MSSLKGSLPALVVALLLLLERTPLEHDTLALAIEEATLGSKLESRSVTVALSDTVALSASEWVYLNSYVSDSV